MTTKKDVTPSYKLIPKSKRPTMGIKSSTGTKSSNQHSPARLHKNIIRKGGGEWDLKLQKLMTDPLRDIQDYLKSSHYELAKYQIDDAYRTWHESLIIWEAIVNEIRNYLIADDITEEALAKYADVTYSNAFGLLLPGAIDYYGSMKANGWVMNKEFFINILDEALRMEKTIIQQVKEMPANELRAIITSPYDDV